ncbi:c-type cytochrome [Polaromonas sp. JS666]|uniref:c-type cytochrome n=1 Tax=Polaromonas sp. (strain JS666 / ATCC BAA-500) TaxID=296591 RepID=UPI00088EE626|nr:c-type cytochrome [Polaromonas sp. JS666]SDN96275.1 cytochrome c [Polaromonas sp. JS666]
MIEKLKQNHSTSPITAVLRSLVTALLATLAACASVWPVCASASQALAQKYACVACHQPAVKVVGPSWKDIGARYGEGKGSAAQLAASVKSGSSGKWGTMPMPAQAQVPDADLQSLAQWVLDGAK